jgi:hypothetical protein
MFFSLVFHETPILPNQFSNNNNNHNNMSSATTGVTPSPFSLITTDEVHKCEISELHHRTQPFEHVHSIESDASRDCVTGITNSEIKCNEKIPFIRFTTQEMNLTRIQSEE